MARIRLHDALKRGFDMEKNDFFYGESVDVSPTELRYSDGDDTIVYEGAFRFRRGELTGSLERISETHDGKGVYTATGLMADAAALWDHAQADDSRGALRLLLSGDDDIRGTGYADRLVGGGGDDLIRGRSGADVLEGGSGDDVLEGDGGRDRIAGGNGRDRLEGGTGDDRLQGGRDGDRLFGDAGDDRLEGGAGKDRLTGGAGADLMLGGSGADRFVFASRYDLALGAERDAVGDFSRAQGDRIDLTAIDANMLRSGNQDFDFIGRQGFSDTAGELRFKNGLLMGDVQGDGVADFAIEVPDVDRLSASDLML